MQLEKKHLETSTKLVQIFIENNQINPKDAIKWVSRFYNEISSISADQDTIKNLQKAEPAVPINKSITPDYIVCLEDGKKLESLTKYLKMNYSLSPEQYRKKWKLGKDYPMTASNFSEKGHKLNSTDEQKTNREWEYHDHN